MSLGKKIEGIIDLVISIVLIAASIASLAFKQNVVQSIAIIVVTLLVIFYGVVGYKKPHGNLLRILMAVFAAFLIACLVLAVQSSAHISIIVILPIIACLVCYISGRLNKSWENRILAVLVLLLLLYCAIQPLVVLAGSAKGVQFYDVVLYVSPVLLWVIICGAYFTRIEEHVEAGKAE